MNAPSATCVVGIFVGGASRRMGGHPKGLLRVRPGSDQTVVEHTVQAITDAGLRPVFIGRAPWLDTLALDVPRWPDEPDGLGPIGGLATLCDRARSEHVIALASDMPYVTADLLARLANVVSPAPIVAPHSIGSDGWEPLFARYRREPVAAAVRECMASGRRALRAVFDRLPVEPWMLSDSESSALRDWDEPADVERDAACDPARPRER